MRFWPTLTVALFAAATPALAQSLGARGPAEPDSPLTRTAAQSERPELYIDLLALMSGRCRTLKIAGRDFACKAVAYAHSEKGRVNFAVALDDPSDDGHVISFSGQNGTRSNDNSYELPVDRMLLNSKHRPKVSGLPVPSEELSTGVCRQFGNFAARQVSSISCTATDSKGKKYELLFESDGSPVSVRRVRQSAPTIQDPFK
jgi:hypothetical protein